MTVDPRRTVSVGACEAEAGPENVLHLPINSGTDLALFNALLGYITDQGWVDRDFCPTRAVFKSVPVRRDTARRDRVSLAFSFSMTLIFAASSDVPFCGFAALLHKNDQKTS